MQAQEHAQLRTNLLPEEIITTRLVKAKKPWAVAAVALLLLALTINYYVVVNIFVVGLHSYA